MRRRIDLATRVATRVVATRVVATSVQALLMLLLLLHPFTNKTTIKITTTEAFIVNNNNRINNYNGNNNNNNNNNKSIIIASSLLNVQRYFGGRRITNNNIRHDDDNNNNNKRLTSTSSRRELKLNLSNDQDSSNSNKINNNKNSYNKGLFVLMYVPVAWGTFEPAVRFVYKYQPLMPPLVFSFAYYLVASSVLTICSFLLMLSSSSSSSSSSSIIKTTNNDNDNTNTTISTATTAVAAAPPATTKINTSAMLTTLNDNTTTNNHWTKLPLSIQGGIELGTYLFIGNSFQVIGLKTVPSDRAAFLLQLTTIFVPILKSIISTMSSTTTSTATTSTSLNKTFLTAVSLKTWIACFVALAGVALIGLDNNNDGSNIINNDVQLLHVPLFSIDDGYIVLGAIFYTFHCIRLETYAKSSSSSPIQLATAKAVTETIWSGFVVGCCIIIAILFDGSSDSNMNHHNSMALLSLLPTFIVDTARTSGDNILSYVNDNNNDLLQQISLLISSSSINHLETTAIVNNNGGGEGGGWYTVGLATLWTGSVTVAYTIFAQSFGQAIVPAVTANLIYTTQPFFTAIVAYLLLGERLGTHGYIGGILIGVAVLFVVTTTEEE